MWGAIIGAVVAAIGMLVNSSQQKKQNEANMGLAQFQADANEKYLAQQNAYNSPEEQMKRFQSAGLNPNLIYGQGSPGNQPASLSYPDIKPADYQKQNIDQLIPLFNQSRIVDSQVQAQNASTRHKGALVEVAKLQARVLSANPLLNQDGFAATIDGMKATAEMKQEQVTGQRIKNFVDESSSGHVVNKIWNEVKLLDERFKLAEADNKIKAQVLNGMEFRNAILEVQKKFMTDSEITPQHIMQFVQLLLMKIL